jgi:hypothetical protein
MDILHYFTNKELNVIKIMCSVNRQKMGFQSNVGEITSIDFVEFYGLVSISISFTSAYGPDTYLCSSSYSNDVYDYINSRYISYIRESKLSVLFPDSPPNSDYKI